MRELWPAIAIPVTAVIIDFLIRSTLLALGAALVAAGALILAARIYQRMRQGREVIQQDLAIGGYAQAIAELGSKRLGARIGGVYALERVALGSSRHHPTVMGVLADFIREHSGEKWPPRALELAAADEHELAPDDDWDARTVRPDVQAAVTVIGRRNCRNDCQPVDLNRADLMAADLTYAQLSDVNLSDADLGHACLTNSDLAYAQLARANLTKAGLVRANLQDANLGAVNLTSADLHEANLASADLTGAQLVGANLTNTNLCRGDLSNADLTGANLTGANLTGANLTGAQLVRANFTNANLTNADLTNALWPRESPMPPGWEMTPGSRRLVRASADTRTAAPGPT